MKTTIDRAGRLIVPKAVRKAIGLQPGTSVDIQVHDGSAVISPRQVGAKLVRRGKGPVLVAAGKVPALTAEQVRALLRPLA